MTVYRNFFRRHFNLYENLRFDLEKTLKRELYEELHILRTFDNVVNDIYDNFIDNKGRMYGIKYVGWKLNIRTDECIKEDEHLHEDNKDLYPIYVNLYRNIDDKSLATTDIRGIDINLDEKYSKDKFEFN